MKKTKHHVAKSELLEFPGEQESTPHFLQSDGRWKNFRGVDFLTQKGMEEGAAFALECVRIIRSWLPIEGDSEKPIASTLTIGDWYEDLGRKCISFFEFHPNRGSYQFIATKEALMNWRELCESMQALRTIYGLDNVDCEMTHPYFDSANGAMIPAIPKRILDTIDLAAKSIQCSSDKWPDGENQNRPDSPAKQCENDDEQSRCSRLTKAQLSAWAALEFAEDRQGNRTYAKAWEYLNEHVTDIENELGYKLPTRETFCRYISKAAKVLGKSRNRPRAGRFGRSIVDKNGQSTVDQNQRKATKTDS
jgi:hypothetical protein